jgi:hypothetical protein
MNCTTYTRLSFDAKLPRHRRLQSPRLCGVVAQYIICINYNDSGLIKNRLDLSVATALVDSFLLLDNTLQGR